MKECGESPFLSCSGRGAALLQRCCAEPGPISTLARWTPAQQRTAARCAASGERCGPAGGLSDVSDEGMRREHISLVSRTRRSALRAAPQSRDPNRHLRDGPRLSSAPLRAALRPGNAVAPPEVYQTCLMKECGESKFRSCPGRGAALFALLRRAGTHIDAARWTPAQQRTAARCAADPGNAVAPPEVYQTCLMKECGESKFRSCPGRGAAPFALLRRAGTHIDAVRWTPAQQRTAARCAASGERCGPAGGLSDVSDEGMRWEHIPLVSRTRCSALRAAPQSRDPYRRCEMDPGSAAHRCALRCVRGTLWPRRRFIRRV